MQRMCIYQQPDWPAFRWDAGAIAHDLAAIRHQQGRLLGRMDAIGFDLQVKATLLNLTQEALKTSEIEGEVLDRGDVRSSLARRLGLERAGIVSSDRRVDAIAALVLDATRNYAQKLTAERLFEWHSTLIPQGSDGKQPMTVGGWRTDEFGAMQMVSEPYGRERVRFEAPPAGRVPAEMGRFLAWFEGPDLDDPVLKAAIAHIWFVTIHPFDDGNGRIDRAIIDLALARSEGTSQRFYSMSARLWIERKLYYDTLEAAQRGTLDITKPLAWFLGVLGRAPSDAEVTLAGTLAKSQFWERLAGLPVNERQRVMLNRLLDGFEGKLTSSKWAQIAKCSQDTASRDIDSLIQRGVLAKQPAGGRSTSYSLSI